jgi:Domain of unknown function (DUF1905)/Bacteriocin-protection, YdeI or OmpD-Associated
MIQFTATLLKFGNKGEKTGWTYLTISAEQAAELKADTKQSFRVKGQLDNYSIQSVALLPMGDGDFIMPVNAQMRKGIRKKEGSTVEVKLEIDTAPLPLSSDFLACLEEDRKAHDFFETLSKSHQNYFSKWIESAKTAETKAKRIEQAIKGLSMQMGYGPMIRHFKELKDKLLA